MSYFLPILLFSSWPIAVIVATFLSINILRRQNKVRKSTKIIFSRPTITLITIINALQCIFTLFFLLIMSSTVQMYVSDDFAMFLLSIWMLILPISFGISMCLLIFFVCGFIGSVPLKNGTWKLYLAFLICQLLAFYINFLCIPRV